MSGDIAPKDYQTEWESMMKTYQGIERPFPSGPDDFDAVCDELHPPDTNAL